MGLLILPYLSFIVFCGLYAFWCLWKERERARALEFVTGLLLTGAIVFGICLDLQHQGKVYVFSPMFQFPFLLIFLPLVPGLVLRYLGTENLARVYLPLFLVSGFSTLLLPVFLVYYDLLFTVLGIEKSF